MEVEFAPEIVIPRRRLGQALQFDAELDCSIDAYPSPAIKWFRGNIPLTNNQHYRDIFLNFPPNIECPHPAIPLGVMGSNSDKSVFFLRF